MKLTTKSEYALLALIYIARHQGAAYVKIDDICVHYEIPQKYLEHLLTTLKRSKVIKTKRGSSGGYRLARAAEEIDVARIIRILDGPLAPTESASKHFFAHTPIEKEKKILKVMLEIRNYIASRLEKLTLSDLI